MFLALNYMDFCGSNVITGVWATYRAIKDTGSIEYWIFIATRLVMLLCIAMIFNEHKSLKKEYPDIN